MVWLLYSTDLKLHFAEILGRVKKKRFVKVASPVPVGELFGVGAHRFLGFGQVNKVGEDVEQGGALAVDGHGKDVELVPSGLGQSKVKGDLVTLCLDEHSARQLRLFAIFVLKR